MYVASVAYCVTGKIQSTTGKSAMENILIQPWKELLKETMWIYLGMTRC